MKALRERWQAGEPTLGAWCTIPSPWTAEVAARSGHDWVCVDTQHGLIGYDTMLPMLQAIAAGGVPAFVRVPWNEPGTIMKALDAGAAGVIVPMVNSPEEARAVVGACRYPPGGFRSIAWRRGRGPLAGGGGARLKRREPWSPLAATRPTAFGAWDRPEPVRSAATGD